MKTLAGGLEKGTAIFLYLIDQKSQHHQHGEHGRQMLFPVSVVVFKRVVVTVQSPIEVRGREAIRRGGRRWPVRDSARVHGPAGGRCR